MGRNNSALLVIDMQNGFLNESSPLFIDGAPETVLRSEDELRAFFSAQ